MYIQNRENNKNLQYSSENYIEYLVNCCIPETQNCKLTIPKKWRRKWQPTPVFLPGQSQEQRSLVGCCLWGRTESDTAEATWHACIGEGNGNPRQCFCLENPRNRGAWSAAICEVTQSQTQSTRLSSSSSCIPKKNGSNKNKNTSCRNVQRCFTRL